MNQKGFVVSADNFIPVIQSCESGSGGAHGISDGLTYYSNAVFNFPKSYNATTGVYTSSANYQIWLSRNG